MPKPAIIQPTPEQSKTLAKIKKMLFNSLVSGERSKLLKAAALHSVRKFDLFKLDGCNSMKAFVAKYRINESYAYSLLRIADKIAALSNLSEEEMLGPSHVEMYIGVQLRHKAIEMSNPMMLLSDGDATREATPKHASIEQPLDPDEIDYDPADEEFRDAVAERERAKRKAFKRRPTLKTLRAELLADVSTAAEEAARKVHELWSHFDGYNRSEEAKRKSLYYIRLADWYSETPPLKDKEIGDWPFMNYEDAFELFTSGELTHRPDIHFAFTGQITE